MRILTGTILAGFAVFFLAAGDPATAMSGKETIDKRKAFMKEKILKPYLVAKKFTKNGEGTAADVASAARALSAAAADITKYYPKGTGRGDFDDKVTRALPKIWEDWAEFQKAAGVLGAEAAKLASVADGGDKDAIAAQFGKTGKMGCGGCHKPFRGAKVK